MVLAGEAVKMIETSGRGCRDLHLCLSCSALVVLMMLCAQGGHLTYFEQSRNACMHIPVEKK